uniref:Uncharacterized protein n=1 Tax=Leersia perrieri TaxID=77586 RepID=A0A0D9XZS2_9ORYZ
MQMVRWRDGCEAPIHGEDKMPIVNVAASSSTTGRRPGATASQATTPATTGMTNWSAEQLIQLFVQDTTQLASNEMARKARGKRLKLAKLGEAKTQVGLYYPPPLGMHGSSFFAEEKEQWWRRRRSRRLIQQGSFESGRRICDELRLSLVDCPERYRCRGGYEGILDFGIAVEKFHDLIRRIESRRLEEEKGRNAATTLFSVLKGRIANKFERSVACGGRDSLAENLFTLHDGVAELYRHLQRGVLSHHLQTGGDPSLGDDTSRSSQRNLRLWTTKKDVFGRERETEQIVQWLIKQPAAENSEIINADHIRLFAILGVAEFFTSKLLQHALTGKRLLLVLDDVWADYKEDTWRALAATLRNCKSGSCILLTTRLQSVVDIAAKAIGSPAGCLQLDELGENDNFLLLMSRLPPEVYSEDCTHLRLIGEQIAKHTEGCPLVTVNVASWLGSHMETHHWNDFLEKGWQKMGLADIFASLQLSYDHLSPHLQNCFRYCSIFPKGYRFNQVELANMWISSGLPISSLRQGGGCAEDVGEEYFNTLVRKFIFFRMLQVDLDGNLKEHYAMHSLMHDCAVFVSRYECARVDDDCFQHVQPATVHLFVSYCGNLAGLSNLAHLRTLIIQGEFDLDQEAEHMLGNLLSNSKHLRMLYLDVPSLSHALDIISGLSQLRYLFLYSCGKSHLQRIFELNHLQVFHLKYFTSKEEDLVGIQISHSLRCLHIPDSIVSKILQMGMPTTLQELHGFEVAENDDHKLSVLSTLTNLQRLSLKNLQNVKNCEEATEVKLKDKPYMRFLSLSWNKFLSNPDYIDHQIIDCLEPNKKIQQLHIHGYNGVQLPKWIENSILIHLVSLELDYCMKWRSLPSFKELRSLKYLKLEHLFQLGSVVDEQYGSKQSDTTFLPPFLSTLIVRWCPNLKKLPPLPCSLEKLILKHVGLIALPRIQDACVDLTSLDGLFEQQRYLRCLKALLVKHCEKLCHLPAKGFTELHHLGFLGIVSCPMLNVKTEGRLLPISLMNLDFNQCGLIESSVLMSLHHLTYLSSLLLFSCDSVEKLPSDEVFRSMRNLTTMSIAKCKQLLSLGGLGAAFSLKALTIMCCDKIQCSYSSQASCSFKLQNLKIDRQSLLLAEPLKSLTCIVNLHIGDDSAMEFLFEEWLLKNAHSLCSIEIGVAENLRALPSQIEKLESLQNLHIERGPRIQILPQLPVALSKLTIWGCDPQFVKLYTKDVGSDWGKIKNIAQVDMKAYSEDTSYNDDQIQYFDDSYSNRFQQFVVIDY